MPLNKTKQYYKCCSICREIKTQDFPEEYYVHYPIRDRLCYESKDFVVFPSISPLAAGHTLIFPKKHVTNLMHLSSSVREELCETAKHIGKCLSMHFGTLYIMEHGVANDNETACGINHAHLHFIPMSKSVAEKVGNRVRELYYPDSFGTLLETLNHQELVGSYLLFGQNLEYLHIAMNHDIPSQFMRRIIAEELGNKKWDWKQLYGWEHFRDTYLAFNNSATRTVSHSTL